MRLPALFFVLALCASAQPLPIRGIHFEAPRPEGVPKCVKFIREVLPKQGVNTLVLEVNYRYQYAKRPEVVDQNALSKDDLLQIVQACKDAHVRFIPQLSCLGHQSWAKTTFGLLRAHPEFDETPGKYPNNEKIYCRSYCPQHPGVHAVIFDLMDELADVTGADAVHVGMDEVFLLGENDCPRCRGKNKAELFANEVRTLRDHLAKSNREMWMWGDRFLDGETTGLGEWEASMNQTAPAINLVPKDVIMCDWHYRQAPPTAPYFALQGFRVVSCPWRQADVGISQLEIMQVAKKNSPEAVAGRMQGVLQTTWRNMDDFVKAYYGEDTSNAATNEAVYCFREMFSHIRKEGLLQ